MKIKSLTYLFIALACGSLQADTIQLKTGEKYTGQIMSEDADSYLVQIEVTKTIKDERRIKKSLIANIERTSEEDKEWKTIAAFIPTADQTPAATYLTMLEAGRAFTEKYPKSQHLPKAKALIATLEKEHRTISQGGIKHDGQLISKDDLEANAYAIDASMLFHKMKQHIKSGKHQLAMRTWEQLKNEFPHSAAYRDSIPHAQRTATQYGKQLKNLIDTLETRTQKRQTNIESLNKDDRSRTEELLIERKAAYEKLIEKEEKEIKTRWLTVDPFHAKALEYNLRSTETTLSALNNLKPGTIKIADGVYRSAWTALAKNNLEKAATAITQLKSLRVQDKYISPLASQLDSKQANKKAAEEKARQAKMEADRLAREAAEKARKAAEEAQKNKGKKGKKEKKKKLNPAAKTPEKAPTP